MSEIHFGFTFSLKGALGILGAVGAVYAISAVRQSFLEYCQHNFQAIITSNNNQTKLDLAKVNAKPERTAADLASGFQVMADYNKNN